MHSFFCHSVNWWRQSHDKWRRRRNFFLCMSRLGNEAFDCIALSLFSPLEYMYWCKPFFFLFCLDVQCIYEQREENIFNYAFNLLVVCWLSFGLLFWFYSSNWKICWRFIDLISSELWIQILYSAKYFLWKSVDETFHACWTLY